MRIDRAGYPFILGALGLAVLAWLFAGAIGAVPLVGLAAFLTFFFRDPSRQVVQGTDLVVSPADGRVMIAGPVELNAAPPGSWKQISVFLSPMDVHINRMPVGGRITKVLYQPGRFLPAYRAEAATSNERSEIWIDHDGQTVVARQIVGILARRVVCRAREGDIVAAGDRFGVMKFGSRMDIFVPATATIEAQVGARVRAGESILARLQPGRSNGGA